MIVVRDPEYPESRCDSCNAPGTSPGMKMIIISNSPNASFKLQLCYDCRASLRIAMKEKK